MSVYIFHVLLRLNNIPIWIFQLSQSMHSRFDKVWKLAVMDNFSKFDVLYLLMNSPFNLYYLFFVCLRIWRNLFVYNFKNIPFLISFKCVMP